MNTNTSSGVDYINAKSIKCVKHKITGRLTVCINRCRQGMFPENLKTAKVTPIYKSGNYRPISVSTSCFYNIRKICLDSLRKYLNSIRFLYEKQYSFRPKSNTLSATVNLFTKVRNNIDEKKVGFGIFIDLKKAFDTVSHRILKLETRPKLERR